MSPTEPNSIPPIALLSATSATDATAQTISDKTSEIVGGKSLLEYQMNLLARAGVIRFLVEVDNVTGALLRLADESLKKGWSVEFVRSGSDVQRLLQPAERLWVQSENLYASPALLNDLLKQPGTLIATVDGRDDNDAFERIDLNTRWAGLALVDYDTTSALQDLPEGWSITSSLLRQALQDKVGFCPVNQRHVQAGEVRIIQSVDDIGALNRHILVNRSDQHQGYIESNVLAPLAARIAPAIWHSSIGAQLVGAAGILSAVIALVLGVIGWDIGAVAAGLVAIVFNVLRDAVVDPDDNGLISNALPVATWVLLGLATIAAARADMSYSSDGIFAALTVVGLALLAQKLALPVWAEHVLKSPALLGVVALLATPVIGFTQSMQWMGVGQLGLLILSKWRSNTRQKKTKQA
jgi:hypothetical protein